MKNIEDASFETFFPGEINSAVYAELLKITTQQQVPQVIIIHGANGTGKTHLLRALKARCSNSYYVTTGELISNIEYAITHNVLREMMVGFQTYNLLIIDDLQFVGRETVEEFLIAVLKDLLSHRKQVVMAADILPGSFIKKLQEITPISFMKLYFPEHKTLCELVKHIAVRLGLPMPTERLIDYILAESNYRSDRIAPVILQLYTNGIL